MNKDQSTNNIIHSSLGIINSMSFYAPLITLVSIFIFSLFSGAVGKGLFYLFWIFVITAVRMLILWKFPTTTNNASINANSICSTGQFFPYSTSTYSTYILSFTLFYFIVPMIIISNQNKTNAINYSVILFFVAYIVFDIITKLNNECIKSVFSTSVISDLLGGIGFGFGPAQDGHPAAVSAAVH